MHVVEKWLEQAESYRISSGRPLVTLSYAQSLDGCIALQRGQPTPLSGPESSAMTHRLRALHDAILVGVGTVLADDPLLTVRLADGDHPQPVILDSLLRTPSQARLMTQHPLRAWVAATEAAHPTRLDALEAAGASIMTLPADENGRVSLSALLESLADQGINSLMVEGGARVITAFLTQRLIDQVVLTIAPVYLGGLHAVESIAALPQQIARLHSPGCQRLGEDLIIWGKLDRR